MRNKIKGIFRKKINETNELTLAKLLGSENTEQILTELVENRFNIEGLLAIYKLKDSGYVVKVCDLPKESIIYALECAKHDILNGVFDDEEEDEPDR